MRYEYRVEVRERSANGRWRAWGPDSDCGDPVPTLTEARRDIESIKWADGAYGVPPGTVQYRIVRRPRDGWEVVE